MLYVYILFHCCLFSLYGKCLYVVLFTCKYSRVLCVCIAFCVYYFTMLYSVCTANECIQYCSLQIFTRVLRVCCCFVLLTCLLYVTVCIKHTKLHKHTHTKNIPFKFAMIVTWNKTLIKNKKCYDHRCSEPFDL